MTSNTTTITTMNSSLVVGLSINSLRLRLRLRPLLPLLYVSRLLYLLCSTSRKQAFTSYHCCKLKLYLNQAFKKFAGYIFWRLRVGAMRTRSTTRLSCARVTNLTQYALASSHNHNFTQPFHIDHSFFPLHNTQYIYFFCPLFIN